MSVDRAEGLERPAGAGVGNGVGGDEEEAVMTMAAPAATATAAEVTTTAVRYYPVAPGIRLNVRRGPGTQYPIVRILPEGARVPIFCQTPGTTVTGPYGTTNIWDNIDDGEYVSDAYVNTGSDGYVRPRCS
ncbi:SH3 domain-containing protein [Streptomyces shaanxiensis]|uniref:SH3 domain-containing protein n=1 Tax=Streptomyces shaanxiensis TaxID=653357 RepID=A0ABP7WDL5_9ACTN